MKSITKNSTHSTLHIGYQGKYIQDTANTKFLGLEIDSHLNLKNDIDQMIPNLSGASFSVKSLFHISNINTLKSV
jgi:hypothetical protein